MPRLGFLSLMLLKDRVQMRRRLLAWFLALCSALAIATEDNGKVLAPVSFAGIWELDRFDKVVMPEDNQPQYTDQAKANLERYKKWYHPVDDDPARICLLKGMPWTMLIRARGYPVEIYQREDRIFMFFELYDNHRRIHLDRTEVPASVPYSANGFSFASWQGNTLVIKTGALSALNPIGPYQRTSSASITEYWRLVRDESGLDLLEVDVEIVDPPIYKSPAKGRMVFKRSAPDVEVGGYGCSEDLWDKHVEQVEARLRREGVDR
jgi:hypothetical protein